MLLTGSSFFNVMDGRQRLLALVLLLIVTTTVLSVMALGNLTTAIIGVVILGTLWITRSVWSPDETVQTKLGTASLKVVASATIAYFKLFEPDKHRLAGVAAHSFGVSVPKPLLESWVPAAIVFGSIAFVIVVLNFFARQPLAAGGRRIPDDPALRRKNFRRRLDGFCRSLLVDLNTINYETQWSSEHFVPLDADVEVVSARRKFRRITDLLSSIRRNRNDRLFLVLGDPGSGKSVALRVLCERLLSDVNSNGKIPIYINLKEWTVRDAWSHDNPPTSVQLRSFIISNLKARLGATAIEFIDDYFPRMLDNGMFFIVFDSFDEIPAILDVNDSSWLIEQLSSVFEQFFFGGTDSKGIIASRYFRRPRLHINNEISTLSLRPFSEPKIAKSLNSYEHIARPTINQIFSVRNDLIPLARNPFTASLIVDFLRQRRQALPDTQSDIYRSYIDHRLEVVQEVLDDNGLEVADVLACAIAMAGFMFEAPDVGLEVPVVELEKQFPQLRVSAVVEVLVAAKIGRRGGLARGRFSFVHRRFNEYFFVRYLVAQGGW
jgi:hypothetical protein